MRQFLRTQATSMLAVDFFHVVPRSVFPARHAGRRSGGMGTVSDDIGSCEPRAERRLSPEQAAAAAMVAEAKARGLALTGPDGLPSDPENAKSDLVAGERAQGI
jgi:hypothetical protein